MMIILDWSKGNIHRDLDPFWYLFCELTAKTQSQNDPANLRYDEMDNKTRGCRRDGIL